MKVQMSIYYMIALSPAHFLYQGKRKKINLFLVDGIIHNSARTDMIGSKKEEEVNLILTKKNQGVFKY